MSNKLSFARGQAYLGTNAPQPPNWNFENRPPTQFDNQNYSLGDLWLDQSDIHVKRIWVLVSLEGDVNSKGVLAEWVQLGGGDLETLSGDSGINPVFPDLVGNINVFGDNAVGVTVSGDGINTLTVTTTNGLPLLQTLSGDSGTNPVFPDANLNINVVGDNAVGLTVSGDGINTLTVTTFNGFSLLQSLTGDTGGAVFPDANQNIFTLGTAGNITVTGNPGTNTLTWNIGGSVATTYQEDVGTATPALNILNVVGDGNFISTSGAGNTITISGSYVQNTWTPTLAFGGSSVGITYSLQEGFYSRIGNTVFYAGAIILTSKGAQVGAATIEGLPFSEAVAVNTVQFGLLVESFLTFSVGFTNIWQLNTPSSTQLQLFQGAGTGISQAQLTDVNFANNTQLSFTGFYFTNP